MIVTLQLHYRIAGMYLAELQLLQNFVNNIDIIMTLKS